MKSLVNRRTKPRPRPLDIERMERLLEDLADAAEDENVDRFAFVLYEAKRDVEAARRQEEEDRRSEIRTKGIVT